LRWDSAQECDKATLVEQATELLGERCIIVALDGLEVVQESPGTVAYGKLLSPEQADLLHRLGRETGASLTLSLPGFAGSQESRDKGADSGPRPSLIVLTSRFLFPDLTAYLGGSLRTLPLPELEPSKGAELLQALGELLPERFELLVHRPRRLCGKIEFRRIELDGKRFWNSDGFR
jgi:hypothetical protein